MKGLTHRLSRWLRDCSGTNLVEAAIVAPLLIFLSFAIIDFAMLFSVYLALENGVSQASRYGVTGQSVAGATREASLIDAMKRATPTLTLNADNFTFTHLPPGGTAWVSGTGGPNDVAKITVNYTWAFLTPIMRPLFNDGSIKLTVESAMKNESRFEQ